MGLFSFVKSVGKKLGIGGDDAEKAPDAEAIQKDLASYDLGTDKVQLEVVGDKVVLKGEVADQTALEKAIVAVGNTLGVSAVDTDSLKVASVDAGAPAKEPVFYEVKKGDNLWKIAEKHYGKGKGAKHTIIFEANRPMLSHPDKIYPGQNLRIPELD